MAYDGKILRRACQKFEEDRQQRQERFQSRRESIFLRQPRLRQIEGELRATMSRIIASALRRGTDPLPAVEVLREENLGLQEEKRRLLAQMGLPEDALEEKPACDKCGDTGYVSGGVCACLRAYYAREQLAELSRLLPLGEDSFETFSFDWYDSAVQPAFGISPRENMERNYDVCRDYAYQFAKGSGDLLLSGGTGLGKTFLSACIARVVSENGFSVVYDTAGHVFARCEAAKFRSDEEPDAAEDVRRYEKSDLLILDEPTNGLDPAGIQEMRELICDLPRQFGMTVVVSSHLLSEIDQMATHVGIIADGALVYQDTIERLHEKSEHHLALRTNRDDAAMEVLAKNGIACEARDGLLLLPPLEDEAAAHCVRLLTAAQIGVIRLEERRKNLEDIFLDLTEGANSL